MSDEVAKVGDDAVRSAIVQKLMETPEGIAMLQSQLTGMVGGNSGYYDSLPKVVKRRVKALKNLQVEAIKNEAEMAKEIHRIECKYMREQEPLRKKLLDIISGSYEPTDKECELSFKDDCDDENCEMDHDGDDKDGEDKKALTGMDEETKGIPHFWLTVLQNCEISGNLIQEDDIDALKHLDNINVTTSDDGTTYTIEFHFSPNDFFTNSVLTKKYFLTADIDPEDPLQYSGLQVNQTEGCDITWKKGKNLCVKTVEKKQKHKTKGDVRIIKKEIKSESFFSIFSPPPADQYLNVKDVEDDVQEAISIDFELGEMLRLRVLPRAVLFFTGEAADDDDFEDEDDDEEGDDDDDDDEDNDADFDPATAKDPNCKQQ